MARAEATRKRRRPRTSAAASVAESQSGSHVVRALVLVVAACGPAHWSVGQGEGVPPARPRITLERLLQEMTDRTALARLPDPPYVCRQFSSYDRSSRSPDDPATWFANNDAGHFLRTIETAAADGAVRREHVMAEMEGPGCVVRVWSANPRGTLRIYLDGSTTPVIEAPMEQVLGGAWSVGDEPIGDPWAGVRGRGYNLYLPVPYARRCLITSDAEGFYYHVNWRQYPADTEVESFSPVVVSRASIALHAAATALTNLRRPSPAREPPGVIPLRPGERRPMRLGNDRDSAAIATLFVGLREPEVAEALRLVVFSAEFDGEQTVWAPLAAFFPVGASHTDYYYAGDGIRYFRSDWYMPFERSAVLTLENLGSNPVHVWMIASLREAVWTDRSMHFHARWHEEHPLNVRAGQGTADWTVLDVRGPGVYAGDMLTVFNPVEAWWGEGDEKIYIDDETFPSHFGTGTEDYFGYAWGSTERFRHPFHALVRCDGTGSGNHRGWTTVLRRRALDAIPFRSRLRFDLELWHWHQCEMLYSATTFFYARPGAVPPAVPVPERVRAGLPAPLLPPTGLPLKSPDPPTGNRPPTPLRP